MGLHKGAVSGPSPHAIMNYYFYYDILSWTNVILAGIVAYLNLRMLSTTHYGVHWLRIGFILISFYWIGIYTWVALTIPGSYDPLVFGRIFVRPGLTITLGLLAGSALYRWGSNVK